MLSAGLFQHIQKHCKWIKDYIDQNKSDCWLLNLSRILMNLNRSPLLTSNFILRKCDCNFESDCKMVYQHFEVIFSVSSTLYLLPHEVNACFPYCQCWKFHLEFKALFMAGPLKINKCSLKKCLLLFFLSSFLLIWKGKFSMNFLCQNMEYSSLH